VQQVNIPYWEVLLQATKQQLLSTDESIRAHMTTHQHSSLVDALLCTCTCTVIWESFVDKIFLQHKIVQKLSSRKFGGEGVWG